MEPGAPRYRIGQRIGRGGMAEVFEGVALGAEGFERRVAIKRMTTEVGDEPAFRRRFLDEARIASQLHHANLVAVLDFGLLDGTPFQVLERVDGRDADALLRQHGALPVAVALYVCAEVARGLAHAHDARDSHGNSLGIVHRDVSPSNVLVSWDADVKLTDFGIAFARGRGEATVDGSVKGTPAFMAPEQWLGGPVDARADLFALGCVLHALVTGASPLAGDGAVHAAIAGEPIALDASLPEDVRSLVAHAVEPRREWRFANAHEMARALETAAAARAPEGGRAAARTWLASVRPPASPPPTSRARSLDVLLGVDSAAPADARGATFVTRVAEAPLAAVSRPIARRRWLAGGAAGGLLLVAASVVPWRAPHPSPAPRAVVLPPRRVSASPPVPIATSQPIDPRPIAPTARPMPLLRVRPSSVAHDAATADDATGWLMVVGPGAVRGLLVIDGTRHAEAHQLLALPVGRHRIELRRIDGRGAVAREVELRRTDTRASPQRWVVE